MFPRSYVKYNKLFVATVEGEKTYKTGKIIDI